MIKKYWDIDNYDFGQIIVDPLPPYGSVTIIDPPIPVVKD